MVHGNVYTGMSVVVLDIGLEIGVAEQSPDVELPHCEYLAMCFMLNFELKANYLPLL